MGYIGMLYLSWECVFVVGGVGGVALNRLNENMDIFEVRSPIGQ